MAGYRYVGNGAGKQQRIINAVRKRILMGELRPGEALPSNRELRQAFEVTPVTVSRAVRRLVEAGHVVSLPRRGVFVADPPPHRARFGLAFFAGPDKPAEWTRLFDILYGEARRGLPGSEARFEVYTHIALGPGQGDYDRLLRDLREVRIGGLLFASDPWFAADIVGGPLFHVPDTVYMAVMHAGRDARVHAVVFSDLVPVALDCCVQRGCRSLGVLLSSSRQSRQYEDRLVAVARAAGVEIRLEWVQYADLGHPDMAANLVHLLFTRGQVPEALLVADDNFLVPAEEGLLRAGVAVPADVLVIAHTNVPPPVLHRLPVDLIGYDIQTLLDTAVRTFRAMRDGVPPGASVIPCLPVAAPTASPAPSR